MSFTRSRYGIGSCRQTSSRESFPVKAARIRHLDTIVKDVDGNRLSTEPIPVFSMDYGVGDCLAQNLLGNLKRVDTRDALDGRVRRKFLATATTASEIISPDVPHRLCGP